MSTALQARTSIWGYYRFATLAALAVYGLVAVYAGLTHNWSGLAIVALLAVVEISLSFDNALVNAKYVERLSPQWQTRFLRYGILIAVVGMRLLFPIIVVSLSSLLNPVDVVKMAFTDPHAYAASLEGAYIPLVAFGGTYLLQIFLNFFLNAEEKDATWLVFLEMPLEWVGGLTKRIGLIASGAAAVAVGVLAYVWSDRYVTVLIAGGASIVLFQGVSFIGGYFDDESDEDESGKDLPKNQLVNLTGRAALFTFFYLELQDSMFSFDGALGAFAFTFLVALIMAGLGIGALFVRSMTIHLVAAGALAKFRYLGNGAFWAIGVLPFSMWFRFPEFVTGGISFVLIVAALLHSIYANRHDQSDEVVVTATGEAIEV